MLCSGAMDEMVTEIDMVHLRLYFSIFQIAIILF